MGLGYVGKQRLGGIKKIRFRCKKRGRGDSRPGWWKYQSDVDCHIGDTREQEQGRLGGEHVDKEQVVLYSLDQTVKGNVVWDSC